MPLALWMVLGSSPWILPALSSGLSRSIGSHPWTILLILMGVVGIGLGVLGLVQTRRWPRPEYAKLEPVEEKSSETNDTTERAVVAETKRDEKKEIRPDPYSPLAIFFPDIEERHPDVWAHDEPLRVSVKLEEGALDEHEGLECSLSTHKDGQERPVGNTHMNGTGNASFEVPPVGKGEAGLVARVETDGNIRENARLLRFVDYRSEIVETFEDFEKWAKTHYPFPRRSLTAREFVDRYADLVPNTPVAPLDKIVDIYELANFSEHPVDRTLYLDLVDAFLELEDAGALDGPQKEAKGMEAQ